MIRGAEKAKQISNEMCSSIQIIDIYLIPCLSTAESALSQDGKMSTQDLHEPPAFLFFRPLQQVDGAHGVSEATPVTPVRAQSLVDSNRCCQLQAGAASYLRHKKENDLRQSELLKVKKVK